MDSLETLDFSNTYDTGSNPGLLENIKNGEITTNDAYHKAILDNATSEWIVSDAWKSFDRFLSEHDSRIRILEPDEANQLYGIDGNLKFDKPVNEAYAQSLNASVNRRLKNEYLLSHAQESKLSRGLGTVEGFAVSLLDPFNLAAQFIPVIGEARDVQIFGKVIKMGAFEGLGTGATKLLGKAGGRVVIGGSNAAFGALAAQPLVQHVKTQEQQDYGMMDALQSVGLSALGGGLIHSVIGKLFDIHDSRVEKQLKLVSEESKLRMQEAGIMDHINGNPVESPAKIAQLDINLHEQAAAQNPEIISKYPEVAKEVQVEFGVNDKLSDLWKMTKREVSESFSSSETKASNKEGGLPSKGDTALQSEIDSIHTAQVEDALKRGLPVPKEVLAEFQDLKARFDAGEFKVRPVPQEGGEDASLLQAVEPISQKERTNKSLSPEKLAIEKQKLREEIRAAAKKTQADAVEKFRKAQITSQVGKKAPEQTEVVHSPHTEKIVEAQGNTSAQSDIVKTQIEQIKKDFSGVLKNATPEDMATFQAILDEVKMGRKDISIMELARDCALGGGAL